MADNESRYRGLEKADTVVSGILHLVFSALFVVAITYAIYEGYLADDDEFVQLAVYIIFFLAILTWNHTALWFIGLGLRKQQTMHTIASGIWLHVFSVIFAALVVLAYSENYLIQDDAYLQAVINLILTLAILTWAATVIWLVQRGKPDLIRLAHPAVRYVVAGTIAVSCISFVILLLLLAQAYGSYLQGEYSWGYSVVIGIAALFLFGGAWHIARLARPRFMRRRERPFTRRGPRVLYVALCISVLAGAGSLFVSIASQSAAPVVPYQFTLEAGTSNTSVILLIGDGMGPAHMDLGRVVEYGPGTNASYDRFPHETTVSTDNIEGGTTDSGAGGTAISTGRRTQNGRIATSPDGQNLTTILEIAKQNGYATGLITICQLAHATPAVFAAHQSNREMYAEIVADMVSHDVDLLLGGGWSSSYFGPHVASMQAAGYAYATNKTGLAAIASTPALGLFASGNLPKFQDYTDASAEPSLLDMVVKGIELLNATGKPFFLMVEESAIDWAGHANDPVYAAHEMIMLDKIINHTINLAEAPGAKLQVLLTADHETGGLQILGTGGLTSPLPNESLPLAENIARRTNRTNEIQVSWSTGGHTSTEVVLAGIGPYTSQIHHANYNIDVFSLMRMAIEGKSGPVEPIGFIFQPVWFVYIAIGGIACTAVAFATLYVRDSKKQRPSI
ncbi:MAG: alkaline phosphatase [Candidatus Lokiarchaeota archaeon]|nr:alkaline phosphatase [Candidatus Lokiarchaeota archaeon]